MINFNQLFRYSLSLVIVILSLASCVQKATEDLPDTRTNNQEFVAAVGYINTLQQINAERNLCFDFSYPIWVVYPDGTDRSVKSDEELFSLLEKWETVNNGQRDYPTIQMPFLVLPNQFDFQVIETENAFDRLFEVCNNNDQA